VTTTEGLQTGSRSPDGTDEVDVLTLVPEAWGAWWRSLRARWRRVDSAALAVIVGQLLVVGPVVVRGSFYIDDWRAQSYAAGQPFWPWIVQSNGTHFSPGARTLDWLQTTYFPLDHGVAVVVTLVVRVLLGVACWRLLRRLTGPRAAALIPLVVVLSTASLLPATAWYRQSITMLPSVIALVLATEAFVRLVARPRVRTLGAVAGWFLIGLCFLEKTLVLGPWLLGLSLLCLPSLLGLRTRLVIRRAVAPVVVVGLLSIAFLAVYARSGEYNQGSKDYGSAADVLDMVRLNLTHALGPALVGGPWQWDYPSPYYGVGDPPLWLMAVAAVVVAVYAIVLARQAPVRLVGGLVAFLALYVASAAITAVGRLPGLGSLAGLDLRMWTDVVVLTVLLAGAVALGPARGRNVGVLRHSATGTRTAGRARPAVVVVGAVALAGVMANVGHSTVTYAQEWSANPAGAYVASLRADLDAVPGRPSLLSVEATSVVPFIDPFFSTEELLAPLPRQVDYHLDTPGTLMATDDGTLRTISWTTVATAPKGPQPNCGWALPPGSGPLTVTFAQKAPYFLDNQLRLSLLVSAPTQVDVAATDATGRSVISTRSATVLPRGIFRLSYRLVRDAEPVSFTISASSPDAGLCVTAATIGRPQPVPAP
jgi:hypothetical protein